MTTNETDQSAADKVQRTAFMDLLEAAKGVIAGFDSGVFVVRNVDHDHEPGSTVKAQPSLLALGNMASPRRGIPIQSMSSFFGVLRRRKYFTLPLNQAAPSFVAALFQYRRNCTLSRIDRFQELRKTYLEQEPIARLQVAGLPFRARSSPSSRNP
jgi:hypothetical protein